MTSITYGINDMKPIPADALAIFRRACGLRAKPRCVLKSTDTKITVPSPRPAHSRGRWPGELRELGCGPADPPRLAVGGILIAGAEPTRREEARRRLIQRVLMRFLLRCVTADSAMESCRLLADGTRTMG